MGTQAERMMQLFRGFAGAHGTYETEDYNPDKRKQEQKRTTRTIRQEVTADLWERHLAGQYHLGIITITEDNDCWWAAVDIDDYDIDHSNLVSELAELGVPAHVVRTKSGGAHIYLFFVEAIPAREVMPKLRELAAAIGRADSEVFPKQMRVATDLQGMGNWMNMPYFGGDDGRNYCVGPDGRGLSVERFLRVASESRLTRTAFLNLKLRVAVAGFEDVPPCLEYLRGVGTIGQGMQNNALFNFAVLAKKMQNEGWEEQLERWNVEMCNPIYPSDKMAQLIKRHRSRDYSYKCSDVPCVNHCNMAVCRERKYGIGAGGDASIVDSVARVDTDPPLFNVTLKTGETVECDTKTLLNPRMFREAAVTQHNVVIPRYKEDTWDLKIRPMIENAVRIEVPAEVGTTGHLGELLERFCTDMHSGQTADDLLTGKPWRDDERGRVWFRLRDLRDFLDRSKFKDLTMVQVSERIKKMGGEHRSFHTTKSTVNVYGLPIDSMAWRGDGLPLPVAEESPL